MDHFLRDVIIYPRLTTAAACQSAPKLVARVRNYFPYTCDIITYLCPEINDGLAKRSWKLIAFCWDQDEGDVIILNQGFIPIKWFWDYYRRENQILFPGLIHWYFVPWLQTTLGRCTALPSVCDTYKSYVISLAPGRCESIFKIIFSSSFYSLMS